MGYGNSLTAAVVFIAELDGAGEVELDLERALSVRDPSRGRTLSAYLKTFEWVKAVTELPSYCIWGRRDGSVEQPCSSTSSNLFPWPSSAKQLWISIPYTQFTAEYYLSVQDKFKLPGSHRQLWVTFWPTWANFSEGPSTPSRIS